MEYCWDTVEDRMYKQGEMKKKLLGIFLAFSIVLTAASCGKNPKKGATTTTGDSKYTIKVIDFDGSSVQKEVSLTDYPTLEAGLKGNFDVASSGEGANLFITSVNGSLTDSYWSLMLYKNGQMASTGVGSISVSAGDVFELKNECWNTLEFGGTFDSYDVLVDKAIYSYAKNTLQGKIADYKTVTMIPYELLGIKMMSDNGYSQSLFNANGLASDYKSAIEAYDLSTLQGANFAKYYFGARAITNDFSSFKELYGSYLEGINEYNSEYELPFTLTFAHDLGLDSKIKESVKNPTYRADFQWGTDGLAYQLTGLAMYNELQDSEFLPFTLDNAKKVETWNGYLDVTLSLFLLPYAASNKDARSLIIKDDKDIIKYLFDNYYDVNTSKFAAETKEGDGSSCQIYASLMAYKIQRDKKKAVNIFA